MVSKKTKLLISASIIIFFNMGLFFSLNIKQFLADRFLHYFSVTPKDVEHIESNKTSVGMIMSIITGIIIKKTSPSLICVLANLVMFLATIGIFIGAVTVDFNILLAMSYVRGFVIEGIFLGQATLVVKLFTGKMLSMVLGLIQVANSMSSAISNSLTPRLFRLTRDLPFCFFVGSCVSFMGLSFAVAWFVLEGRGWGDEITRQSAGENQGEKDEAAQDGDGGLKDEKVELLLLEEEKNKESLADKLGPYSDLKDPNIWLNCVNYAIGCTSDVIFASFSNELFVRRFGFETEQAGTIMSIILLLTIPFTPLYSAIAIKYGKKPQMLILAYISAALSFFYIFLLPTKLDSVWSLAIPIFGYSQYLSVSHFLLYTNIGVVAPKRIVSVAFSISSLMFSIVFVNEARLFGLLLKPDTIAVYQLALQILTGLFSLGAILSLIVYYIDVRRGGILALPENSDKALAMKARVDKGYNWFRKHGLVEKRRSGAFSEKITIGATSVGHSENQDGSPSLFKGRSSRTLGEGADGKTSYLESKTRGSTGDNQVGNGN